MAIDTALKRASALHVGLPWRGLFPLPDGAIDQGDRAQAAGYYRGFAAAAAVIGGLDLVGSYTLTLDLTGSYRQPVDLVGSYVPTLDILGRLED